MKVKVDEMNFCTLYPETWNRVEIQRKDYARRVRSELINPPPRRWLNYDISLLSQS